MGAGYPALGAFQLLHALSVGVVAEALSRDLPSGSILSVGGLSKTIKKQHLKS
jgi:hypothetical protein